MRRQPIFHALRQASPSPTAMRLLNGMDQPFIHVNFYGKLKVTGNQRLGGNPGASRRWRYSWRSNRMAPNVSTT